jgi:hypothetical protein
MRLIRPAWMRTSVRGQGGPYREVQPLSCAEAAYGVLAAE